MQPAGQSFESHAFESWQKHVSANDDGARIRKIPNVKYSMGTRCLAVMNEIGMFIEANSVLCNFNPPKGCVRAV
jgi:hypothetical protein